jgi:superfamily II DNA or RNA helicase
MVEFKQIIGRGTRLYYGKDYFTIYDFVKAHHHFQDQEWDGEPIKPEPREGTSPEPCPVCGQRPCVCEKEPSDPCICDEPPNKMVKVRLSDNKVREGVSELDDAKLADLLELKYHSIADAKKELGEIKNIRDTFIGFQGYLYESEVG